MPPIGRRSQPDDPPLEADSPVRRVLTAPDRLRIRDAVHAETRDADGAGAKRGKGRNKSRRKTNAKARSWLPARFMGGGGETKKAKGTANSSKGQSHRMQKVQRRLHRLRRTMDRFQPLILFLILSLITLSAYALWVTGAATRAVAFTAVTTERALVAAGLKVRTVTIIGAVTVPDSEIRSLLGAEPGMPLLDFDPGAARSRLEALPSIRSATVMRLLPDRLHVDIIERAAFALWQYRGRFSVIARDGTILNTVSDRMPEALSDLPRVVGEGADQHAAALMDLLEAVPALASRLEAASRVGNRRWNLKLDNGIEIRLPDKNEARAIKDIAALDAEHRLLARQIAFIDLRDPDVLVIRPTEGSEAEPLPQDTPNASGRRVETNP